MPRFTERGDFPVSPEEAAEFAFTEAMMDRTPVSEGGGGYGAASLDAAIASRQLRNRDLKILLAGGTLQRNKPNIDMRMAPHTPFYWHGDRFPTGKRVTAMLRRDLPEAKAARLAQVERVAAEWAAKRAEAKREANRWPEDEGTARSPLDDVMAQERGGEPDRLSPPTLGTLGGLLPEGALDEVVDNAMASVGGPGRTPRQRAKRSLLLQEKSQENLDEARRGRMGSIRQREAAMDSELRRQRLQRTAAQTGARRINVIPGAPGLAGLHPAVAAAAMKARGAADVARIANAPMMAVIRGQNKPPEDVDKLIADAATLSGLFGMEQRDAINLLAENNNDLRAAIEAGREAGGGGNMWEAGKPAINLWWGLSELIKKAGEVERPPSEDQGWENFVPNLPYQGYRAVKRLLGF